MDACPKTYESKYVFPAPISRFSCLVNETKYIEELVSKTRLPFLFTDKPTPLTFSYIVLEFTSVEHSKKVIWEITNPTIPTPLYFTFTLEPNTIDNTTLLFFEITLVQREKIPKSSYPKIIEGCSQICVEMIHEIETLLQVYHENIYQFESAIIKAPREKIWNHFLQLGFLKNEHIEDLHYNGSPDQVGTELFWVFKKDKVQISCKIAKISCKQDKHKWKYKLASIDGLVQKQDVEFSIIKINDHETFFSFYHCFDEQISPEALIELEARKKMIVKKIKEKFEGINKTEEQLPSDLEIKTDEEECLPKVEMK